MGNEFLWGDPTGRTWPIHRYADNMQPGVTSREFFWTERDAWGDMKLVAAGNVEPAPYVDDSQRLAGTVPIRLGLPKRRRFTVAINDARGGGCGIWAATWRPKITRWPRRATPAW